MSPLTNYIYLATRNLRLLSLVILRRRRNVTPVNPLNPKIKIWILICWKAYSVSGIVWTPIWYTSTVEIGMVQIHSIAEIVPKSLFLYNYVRTEALSSMAFVPVQKLSSIQCSVNIALLTALKWDILENKATVKTFRSPIHWPFPILESRIVHSVCPSPPPILHEGGPVFVFSEKTFKDFLVAWEQGAAGCC